MTGQTVAAFDAVGFVAGMKALLACDCRVCVRHGETHAQVPRMMLGSTVYIDVEMAPLIDALRSAGVTTVGSCIDLADAVTKLWPEHLPTLLAFDGPGVHYGRIVAERLTFVRMLKGPNAEPFLGAVEEAGGSVARGRFLVQAAFPRDVLPGLAAVA
ncbi:hypothetical protein [Blastococcus saxobsidens]|uniref:Uncharacterized protein n=1 Tax=Blastococcus saxobsidens TaxID=138336 RepID=A0A4Q7Y6U2_9ACTN|nr:hypothetical protein [Blastococcus saxobsidens]RZU32702.1 hypothetical protein BKA19_2403 [Blastococcus saxobsidens]